MTSRRRRRSPSSSLFIVRGAWCSPLFPSLFSFPLSLSLSCVDASAPVVVISRKEVRSCRKPGRGAQWGACSPSSRSMERSSTVHSPISRSTFCRAFFSFARSEVRACTLGFRSRSGRGSSVNTQVEEEEDVSHSCESWWDQAYALVERVTE